MGQGLTMRQRDAIAAVRRAGFPIKEMPDGETWLMDRDVMPGVDIARLRRPAHDGKGTFQLDVSFDTGGGGTLAILTARAETLEAFARQMIAFVAVAP